MNQKDTIQGAVSDLAIIRRAIEKAQGRPAGTPSNRYAIDAGLLFQGLFFVIATALILFELISGRSMTMTMIMMLSAHDSELGLLGLAQVAIALPTLVMCIYFIVWRAAYHSEQSFQDYLTRNFQYLRNLSLVSDLLVKFIPLTFLVIGGHPEWISPLLSLYIADYLIQGRVFTLPIKPALFLGVTSIGVAALQYGTHSSALLYPLAHFASVMLISIIYLITVKMNKPELSQES